MRLCSLFSSFLKEDRQDIVSLFISFYFLLLIIISLFLSLCVCLLLFLVRLSYIYFFSANQKWKKSACLKKEIN